MTLQEAIDKNGLINRIGGFDLNDDIVITTDSCEYRLSEIIPIKQDGKYIFRTKTAEFTVSYAEVENTPFMTRRISLEFEKETALLKISAALPKADEAFMYDTFFNASAAVFLRNGERGMCCGFENPYCLTDGKTVYFEPGIILKGGETFDCDLNFYGEYALWGEMISPCLDRTQMEAGGRSHPRYRNPSEGRALYFSEIQAFLGYTDTYFQCDKKQFKFMVYDFFGNMPQRPENDAEYKAYLEHIDSAVKVGCDTILLNPLFPNKIPNADENSYWELFPENTYADKILKYARKQGLKVGMYTGTAGNGAYGDSSMINFADTPQWKKQDVLGNISTENCIADDSFMEWFIKVQSNTISRYGLDLWNWDPGPGNAFFCFSDRHGHIPGKGAYKGFRNSLEVMRRLKEQFPHLYIEGFHGNKEYGLWGFKYIDQHEAYWENEVYVMNPIYPDLSVDRVTADNIRQQSVWNHYFRFMPETMNHGISHRMIQACWMRMPDLDKVFDYTGWKYALLSAIAAGGSVTPTILPHNPEKIDGYLSFYKKWTEFARKNFALSRRTIPFGAQVGCGIDGYSKISDNQGYIFLFNPFPQDTEFEFVCDRRMGFEDGDWKKTTAMIYPYEKKGKLLQYGASLKYVIPAYGCIVIEVAESGISSDAVTQKALPRVLNVDEKGVCVFFADEKIKTLLGGYKISEEAINTQEEYAVCFHHINSCWSRPDRLWLWLDIDPNDDSRTIPVYFNGKRVDCMRDYIPFNEMCVYNMAFADVTNYVEWGKVNEIKTISTGARGAYLHYPRPQNEELPRNGKRQELRGVFAPRIDKDIQILSARINDNDVIEPKSENTLRAKINIPFDETEGVYASVPISIGDTGINLKRDMVLEYENGYWVKRFCSGDRLSLIIDDNKISVWAVSKNNTESETFRFPVNWRLT